MRDAHALARDLGVAIEVEVVPGSSESRFPAGYNEWRKRIEAKVKAPPEEGKANAELTSLVADAVGVPGARVRVTTGHASRRKTVAVLGASLAQVAEALEKGF